MNDEFYEGEKLYRAIIPACPFMKEDGTVSSGAFRDKNGLSVDRQMKRKNIDAVNFIKSKRKGCIYSVTKENCDEKEIYYTYCPVENNDFHSELHNDTQKKELSKSKARFLAKNCKFEE